MNRYAELASAQPEAFKDDVDTARELLAEVGRRAAQSLLDQGTRLAEEERHDQAIDTYQQLIDSFEHDPDPALSEAAAIALLNKGVMLERQQEPDHAIGTYQQLIDHFGDSPHPALRRRAANAMTYQGRVLAERQRFQEAAQVVERAVTAYQELAMADPGAVGENLESARRLLAQVGRLAAEPRPTEG